MNSLYRFVCAICLLFAVVCTPIQATAELVDSTLPHSITSVDSSQKIQVSFLLNS